MTTIRMPIVIFGLKIEPEEIDRLCQNKCCTIDELFTRDFSHGSSVFGIPYQCTCKKYYDDKYGTDGFLIGFSSNYIEDFLLGEYNPGDIIELSEWAKNQKINFMKNKPELHCEIYHLEG